MSIDAVGWAIGQKALSPAGKLALIVIAESANIHRNHVCDYHDQATLAERASMSVDTLQKRIKELVDADLLFVVKRRANDGSVAKNYYVVLIDDDARRHAAAHGWAPRSANGASNCSEERTAEEAPNESHAADCGMDHAANQPEPCRKSEEAMPHWSGMAINSRTGIDRNLPDSPPPPKAMRQAIGGEGSASRSENGTASADAARLSRWDAFRKLWPWDPRELVGEARLVFLQLSDDDQRAAIDGAPRYIAHCRANNTGKNHGIVWAKKWLAMEGWGAQKARSVESAASLAGAPFFVRQGSPQAAAWAKYETALYGAPRLKFIESKAYGMACLRPTEWPPALASAAGDGAPGAPGERVA